MRSLRPMIVAVLLSANWVSASQQWVIVDPTGQTGFPVASGSTGAAELSGITWAGGDQYYVVGDNDPVVNPMSVTIDPSSGRILSASLGNAITLSAGNDLEGIACKPASGSVFLSDENGAAIREHSLVDGALMQSVAVPSVFSGYRSNLGLESLSRDAASGSLWTANEEALVADGPLANSTAGTTVRLQKFDSSLVAVGQWAYVTDPVAGDIGAPGRDLETSGVSDVLALPGDGLLVLEREVGVGGFRHRIYEVDFSAASDASAIPALDGASFTAVGKFLLWEHFGFENFEGMSLGPTQVNGAQSLLLVSDNGGGLSQSLLALVLLPERPKCAAQPLSSCQSAPSGGFSLSSRGGAHDKISWSWRKGNVPSLTDFSLDPTIAIGHGFALCVYDSTAGMEQLRLSLAIPRGERWKASGTTAFKYSDSGAGNDGIVRVKLRTGAGKAQIQVKGKGSNLQVPPPPAMGNLLSLDSSVTVQLVDRDAVDHCFSTSFSTARRNEATQFTAKY